MLLDIDAPRKAVFDVDETHVVPSIQKIDVPELLEAGWDLVLSCQVLEHLTNPVASLQQIGNLLSSGGWLYVEMPEELWNSKAL